MHLQGTKTDFPSLNISCKILGAHTQILVTCCSKLNSFPCPRTEICASPSLALTYTHLLFPSLFYLQTDQNENISNRAVAFNTFLPLWRSCCPAYQQPLCPNYTATSGSIRVSSLHADQ